MTHNAKSAVQHPSQYALADALARVAALEDGLRDARDNGLIYWEPNTTRGHKQRQLMISRIDALLANQTPIGKGAMTEGDAPAMCRACGGVYRSDCAAAKNARDYGEAIPCTPVTLETWEREQAPSPTPGSPSAGAEPVAWRVRQREGDWLLYGTETEANISAAIRASHVEPLYAAPPQPERTGRGEE